MIDPLVIRVLSLGFGLLLLGAAWHKLSTMPAFRAVLADYRLIPGSVVPAIAAAIAAIEVALGIGWISGAATQTVAIATATLLLAYGGAIAINLVRGRVHISCGCGFGRTSDEPLSWWLVVRNAMFAIAAVIASLSSVPRDLGFLDWIIVVFGLTTSTLLYVGVSQLLKNGPQSM